MAEPLNLKKIRMKRIIDKLEQTYPDAECALLHETPLQLLIATILSAQCTDVRVNMVTPALFAKYPDAQTFAKAPIKELEKLIRSTGFYHNKAKNIKGCSQKLVKEHGGQVPKTMEELQALPGVGRKTANVVLGNVFDVPGMVVDTHVTRLSNRMGFTKSQNAVVIERELQKIVEEKYWTLLAHLLISHGRSVCKARKPMCEECSVAKLCPKIL